MSRMNRVVLPLLLIGVIIAAIVTSVIRLNSANDGDLARVEEAWHIILQNYVDSDEIDTEALSYGAIRGMIQATGDPFAVFSDRYGCDGQLASIMVFATTILSSVTILGIFSIIY